MSYGSECPSHGVYARVTEVKHWIQYIAGGAVDSNCNVEIPLTPGNIIATEQNTIQWYLQICLGILVTGGENTESDAQHSVEVILPDGCGCRLPDLPSPGRYRHSQSGYTACGGWAAGTASTCHTFHAGLWELSHNLNTGRINHVSWNSPVGVIIFGGWGGRPYSYQSSELLSTTDSTTSSSFNLPYVTE